MADNTETLTNTYINDLIQKKIANRQNLPQIEAQQAQSAIAKITGGNPISVAMSGLNALGQGMFGAQDRAAEQTRLDQIAKQQNFKNQEAHDNALIGMLQNTQAHQSKMNANNLNQQRFNKQLENEAISESTRRNTAKANLGLINKIKDLRETKDNLAALASEGVEGGLLVSGGAGQDFVLTEKGKKNLEFAERFNNRADVDDLVKGIQDEYDQDILKRAADKDKHNDIAGLSAQEISKVFLAPSAQSIKAANDINASQATALESEIKRLTGGQGYKNNVFSSSQFDLTESLDAPATDLLDQVSKNAEDPSEVRRLFSEAQEQTKFANLDPAQQKFVLAQFLKDKKGVGSSKKKLGFDLDIGEWSSDTLEDDLPKYVDQFLSAKELGNKINRLKTANATNTALRNLQLSLSGG